MKTQYVYDHYYKYDELTEFLQKLAQDYPEYCRLESFGQTDSGRQQWLMSVTKLSAGDFADKPAFGVNGNIHAGEVTGTMCACHFLDYLLTNRDDNEVDWLLTNFTVYCVPRITPDGAEYYLTTPYSVRSIPKMYPFEEVQPGVQPEDVDGDGVIRKMRVRNPEGAFKISPDDPEVMIRRAPDETEGEFYDVFSEGLVEGYEGGELQPAPGKHGNDFNRNFPLNWLPENKQAGAGSYALSNPETKALADYLFSKPNLCAVLNFHTSGGIYLYPPGFKHAKEADPGDIARIKAIGKMATEETGYPALNLLDEYVGEAAGSMGIVGAFDDFCGYALGIVDFTCECWDLVNRAGHPSVWPRPANTPDEEEQAIFTDAVKWLKENENGEGYKPWTKFDHPQLGEVEIGGFDYKHTVQNPPSDFLQQETEKHSRFLLRAMKTLPRLSWTDVRALPAGENTWKVDATVMNLGYLPTSAMKEAEVLKTAKPVRVTFTGAELISGKDCEDIGHLEGFSGVKGIYTAMGPSTLGHKPYSKHMSWVVKGTAGTEVTLSASCPRAGRAETCVKLEKGTEV
ncbi:MAG: zinc carboxypeptidase [Solobacterium sp.]|nr:zinc carboxypeptidase [Solobacterium sp.]